MGEPLSEDLFSQIGEINKTPMVSVNKQGSHVKKLLVMPKSGLGLGRSHF